MIIKIGDLQLGGESKYQIEPGIQGLDSASIRNGDGVYAGVDGAYMSSQLYGARNIVLTGFYVASSCGEADTLRLNLCNTFAIRKLLPILITTFSGNMYYTEGYVSDLKADIDGARAGEFQVTLFCPDSILYKANQDGAIINTKSATISTITGPTATMTITNTGSVDVFPVIRGTGYLSLFQATNATTNLFVKVEPSSVHSNATIEIFMKERIISQTNLADNTSQDITWMRTTDSRWWSLKPGTNTIRVTSTNVGGSKSVEISYKEGVRGI